MKLSLKLDLVITLKKTDVCNLWQEEEVIKNVEQTIKKGFHLETVEECYPWA